MDDIKIDFKLIIIVLCIAFFIGAIIWLGYNFYINSTKDENEGIEYFKGDGTSNIDSIGKTQTNENDIELDIGEIIGEEVFEINNSDAVSKSDGWLKRITRFRVSGYSTIHYVPNDWQSKAGRDKKDGTTIYSRILKIDNLSQETTYEEALNKFIETKEKNESSPEEVENYTKRTININGDDFYVLVEKEYYNAVYEYFCLVKDDYVYYLEVSTSKEKYNQELIDTINQIFATYRIY